MQVTQYIRKWGNSNAVRLPKKMTDVAKLRVGQEILITLNSRTIVLTPIDNTLSDQKRTDAILSNPALAKDWDKIAENEVWSGL